MVREFVICCAVMEPDLYQVKIKFKNSEDHPLKVLSREQRKVSNHYEKLYPTAEVSVVLVRKGYAGIQEEYLGCRLIE